MIIDLIKSGYGISFVYEVLAKSDPELGIFTLKGEPIVREFNVIYLKHADVRRRWNGFCDRVFRTLLNCLNEDCYGFWNADRSEDGADTG